MSSGNLLYQVASQREHCSNSWCGEVRCSRVYLFPCTICTGKFAWTILFLFHHFKLPLCLVCRAKRDGTGKNRTLWEANRPLVCPFMFFSMTTIWVLASPTNILERDPRCFTFMVGIVFSNICCQLIVAQMSNTRCEVFSWLLIPVGGTVVAALLLPSTLGLELPLLYMLTAFTFLAHVHYGVCLVSFHSNDWFHCQRYWKNTFYSSRFVKCAGIWIFGASDWSLEKKIDF